MKLKLSDFAKISSSKRIFANEYVEKGIPFYRGKEIIEKANRKQISQTLYISKEKFAELEKKHDIPKKGDILLTAVGTLGITYLVAEDDKFYYKDGNVVCIRVISDEIYTKFVYLWTKSEKFKALININSIGSTQRAITINALNSFELNIPPLPEQKRIADILTSLDDKIELNNQMNQTLEEMANVLYKQWFVDFEFPNKDGKPYKSSGGEMVESELGLIPKGWNVYQLGEFIKFIKGKKPTDISVHKENQYERYMTIKGISNSEILYANPKNTVEIQSDEICMVMDGASSGDVYTSIEGILGSTFAKIKTDLPTGFMFQLFKYHETSIKEHLTGSAIPHTDKGYLNKISIILPEISEIENLSENLELYTSLINRNKQNGEILEQQKQIILNDLFEY